MMADCLAMAQYRAVLATAEQMLDFARCDAWQEVSRTAGAIANLSEPLRRFDADGLRTENDRLERIRILTRLITIDGEVRQLRDPGAARLDALLSQSKQNASRTPRRSIDANVE